MLSPFICIQGLALLKTSYNKNIIEIDEGLADLRSTTIDKDNALARAMKDIKKH